MLVTNRAAQELKNDLSQRLWRAGVAFRLTKRTEDAESPALIIRLDKVRSNDEVVESSGVKILLDPEIASSLHDYRLGYTPKSGQSFELRHAGKKTLSVKKSSGFVAHGRPQSPIQ